VRRVVHVFRRWLLSVMLSRLEFAVQPESVPTVRSPGPAPYRLLLVGGGISVGLGVSRRGVALPGQLARHLAAITGRGVDVDVSTRVGTTVSEVRANLDRWNLVAYDAVVLALGTADALAALPPEEWRTQCELLLAGLQQRTSPTARIVVMSLDTEFWAPYLSQRMTRGGGDRVHAFNTISRELCWGLSRTSFVRVPKKQSTADVQHSVQDYDRCGRAVAAHLADRLVLTPAPASGLGEETPPNVTLAGLGLLGLPVDGVIERVVGRLRIVFGVEGSTLASLDHWEGDHDDAASRPSDALAAATAAASGGLAVRDLRRDPRFRDGRLAARHGMAFYAGYPVLTPAAEPLGVLAVFDPHPRSFSPQEMGLLRDHALVIEEALARSAASRGTRARRELVAAPVGSRPSAGA
jgi:hypothetical protein